MRVNINSNGLYSITSVDAETLNTVMFILGHAQERCFREYDKVDVVYHSGADFCMSLIPDELKQFHGFVKDFWTEYANMKAKLFNFKK